MARSFMALNISALVASVVAVGDTCSLTVMSIRGMSVLVIVRTAERYHAIYVGPAAAGPEGAGNALRQ